MIRVCVEILLTPLRNELVVVVVGIGECGVDLLRPQVRVLTQQFLARPPVKVMFRRQIEHLVTHPPDTCRAFTAPLMALRNTEVTRWMPSLPAPFGEFARSPPPSSLSTGYARAWLKVALQK